MKIRIGFVSNSSSSSFVLVFPESVNLDGLFTLQEYIDHLWEDEEDRYGLQDMYDSKAEMVERGWYGDETILENVEEGEKFGVFDVDWNAVDGINALAKQLGGKVYWVPL